jgi:hypothetical protein
MNHNQHIHQLELELWSSDCVSAEVHNSWPLLHYACSACDGPSNAVLLCAQEDR